MPKRNREAQVPALASPVETEADAFARQWVASCSASGTPWSPSSPFSEDASGAFVRQWLRLGAGSDSAVIRMNVIAVARSYGDPDAIAALHETIIERRVRRPREELPLDLENYINEVLHGGMGHQPPAPKRKNKLLRDISIALSVAAVVDRFPVIDATGRSARRRSACAIVADALAAVGRGRGLKAVEAIWLRYRAGMPTVPGWSRTALS